MTSELKKSIREFLPVVSVGALIYLMFFVSLFPAIFSFYKDYFVMSGPNWQDTAMHLSIIQSLSQGNFPPTAPYFSGWPLSYYYFSDFHAAILNVVSSDFFPKSLVILNPFLAMTFFFSVFALSYQITKKKIISCLSAVMATLFGNLGFINLVSKMSETGSGYISLITSDAFNFDKNYIQMTPLADYFLQNRPMMIGLPSVVVVIILLTNIIDSDNSNKNHLLTILTTGVIMASLIRFQMFGVVVSSLVFAIFISLRLFLKKAKIKNLIRDILIFVLPGILTFAAFSLWQKSGRSVFEIFLNTFSWGPWYGKNIFWYLGFFICNFGISFLVYILSFFFKKSWKKIEVSMIYFVSLILIGIPLVMKFTIYEFDMLKFYYYLVPLICVILAFFYSNFKHKKISILIFAVIVLVSSLTSINMLFYSFLNKNRGYSLSDYDSGMWIIKNTPQRSVFVTMPTVHSAPSDIGGRLRVISYINWPYSHGFNVGNDNVFSRVRDVEFVYATGDVSTVEAKYKADYVFYGQEEKNQFPFAYKFFDINKNLELVYNRDEVRIYRIVR